ncbi:MAG: phosphotransferase, partial [Actinomycetota bacterium]
LIEPAAGGARNQVWRGRLNGVAVAVRQSRRPADSLAWELDLLAHLGRNGFRVPTTVPCDDGRRSAGSVVAQTWLEGHQPSSEAEWGRVAGELQRLHAATADYGQRPGCATVRELRASRQSVDADLDAIPVVVAERILAVFDQLGDVPAAVVHGDPGPENIRIGAEGSVGLLDWDESRVDLTWHDLSNLGVQVLGDADHRGAQLLSNAWEAANGWVLERDYALRRLRLLDRA